MNRGHPISMHQREDLCWMRSLTIALIQRTDLADALSSHQVCFQRLEHLLRGFEHLIPTGLWRRVVSLRVPLLHPANYALHINKHAAMKQL